MSIRRHLPPFRWRHIANLPFGQFAYDFYALKLSYVTIVPENPFLYIIPAILTNIIAQIFITYLPTVIPCTPHIIGSSR